MGINLRPDGEGLLRPPLPPPVFCRLSGNGGAHLLIQIFRTCCKKARPSSLKVRSPGHVEGPQKKFECASHSFTDGPIALTHSMIDIRHSIYEIYISNFDVGDKSGQFCYRSITGHLDKVDRRLGWTKIIWILEHS